MNKLHISNNTKISAIYFALLQCGYDYYVMGRKEKEIESIRRWKDDSLCFEFFMNTKQSSCEVYPYWPRAALLETASFYLAENDIRFEEFSRLYEHIMSAGNITDQERDPSLWEWMADFPEAIDEVLSNDLFINYLSWEKVWIELQNVKYEKELQLIQKCVDTCLEKYDSPIQEVKILINPIKCIYSADYHLDDNCFVFSAGGFNKELVIHELLHHVIHSAVINKKKDILLKNRKFKDLDDSYYLSGCDEGRLNAFEEYAVRRLTKNIMEDKFPVDIVTYLEDLLSESV